MSDLQTLNSNGWGHVDTAARNRVLRNTYWLLALSLLPTVLGAWLGVATGITRSLSGGVGLIVFMAGAFGFMFAIEKTKNSAAGVPVLLAFTFFMGLMLSRMIAMVLGFKNGSELIMTAFAGTAGVFFVMASLASVINLLDPEVIVLGGGLSNIGALYNQVLVLLSRHVFSDQVNTRLVPARHGDSSGVRGAAWLWP